MDWDAEDEATLISIDARKPECHADGWEGLAREARLAAIRRQQKIAMLEVEIAHLNKCARSAACVVVLMLPETR